MFPNRETFVKREEFCITLMKLNRTCNSQKKAFLTNKFPTVCHNIKTIMERAEKGKNVCQGNRWSPVRHLNFAPNDSIIFRLVPHNVDKLDFLPQIVHCFQILGSGFVLLKNWSDAVLLWLDILVAFLCHFCLILVWDFRYCTNASPVLSRFILDFIRISILSQFHLKLKILISKLP